MNFIYRWVLPAHLPSMGQASIIAGLNIVAVLGKHMARWGEQVGQQMIKQSVVSPVLKDHSVAVRPALMCTLHSTSAGRGCLLFLEYSSASVYGEPLYP